MSGHVPILKPELQALIEYAATLSPKSAPPSRTSATPEDWRALAGNLKDAMKALELGAGYLDDAAKAAEADAEDSAQEPSDRADFERMGKRLRTGAESTRARENEATDLHDRALVYAKRAKPAAHLTLEEEAHLEEAQSKAAEAAAAAAEARARAKEAEEALKQEKAATAAAKLAEANAQLTLFRTALDAALAVAAAKSAGGDASGKVDLDAAATKLTAAIERHVKLIAEQSHPEQRANSADHWKKAKGRLIAAQSAVESAREKLGEPDGQDELSSSFTEQLDLLAEMTLVLRRRLEQVAGG